MSTISRNLEAAGLMVLSMALFTSGDAIIKHLSDNLPIGEILFFRGLIVCVFFAGMLTHKRQIIFNKASLNKWNLCRALCELGVAFTFLTGVVLLPLATATVLIFSGPLMLTILAALILREHVGWRRWLAVVLGFVGVILVADPEVTEWSWAIAFPLLAALLTAIRDIIIRYVPPQLSSLQVAFTTAWIVTLGGLTTAIAGWQTLHLNHIAWLFLGGVFIFGAYLSYVVTTRIGELSFVSPFKYTTIPLAILLGYLVWGEIPSRTTLIGTIIIISSGLVILYREKKAAAV